MIGDDDYDDYEDDDDDDGGSDLTISTFMSPLGTPGPLMISSGVNTSVHGLIARLVNDDGVIITGNPTDFVAALNVRMGYVFFSDSFLDDLHSKWYRHVIVCMPGLLILMD